MSDDVEVMCAVETRPVGRNGDLCFLSDGEVSVNIVYIMYNI